MPEESDNILNYSHGQKSLKIPFVTCEDIVSLLGINTYMQ